MLRSMYSGITGLRNFQTKLDVIGNNIANVNTYGFKKGRTVFKDLVSQTVAGASAPTDGGRGGVNPKQVGLGAQLATIDTLHGQGSMQFTGNTLDLTISGDGFFVVQNGADGEEDFLYTRAGNFYLDAGDGDADTDTPAESATLVDGDGRKVLSTEGEPIEIPANATSISIGQDGAVNFVVGGELNLGVEPQIIQIAKFSNPSGLTKVGGNLFEQSANSGAPERGRPGGDDGQGFIESGFLEMSNVDLAEEFTEMIVAQRGFQANTRTITTSDEILQELMNLKR